MRNIFRVSPGSSRLERIRRGCIGWRGTCGDTVTGVRPDPLQLSHVPGDLDRRRGERAGEDEADHSEQASAAEGDDQDCCL